VVFLIAPRLSETRAEGLDLEGGGKSATLVVSQLVRAEDTKF
jgi:hypothetical protein